MPGDWIKWYPRRFEGATKGWPGMQKVIYRAALEQIYLTGDEFHISDFRWLPTYLGFDRKTVRKWFERLVELGKLTIDEGGYIHNSKATEIMGRKRNASGKLAGIGAGISQHDAFKNKDLSKKKKYAFDGKVVRLNDEDFNKWMDAYSHLDLKAELIARDVWLTAQPRLIQKSWFVSTSRYLANRNAEAKLNGEAREKTPEQIEADDDFIWENGQRTTFLKPGRGI